MTSYNGQALEYDAIGNPLTYRDGITLTWQNGRELATFANADTSVAYTYDVDGLRTGKTVTQNGTATEYNYVYENGLLLQMTRGSRVYDFSYDANGTPISIAYRTRATATPSYYYYGTNWRGDVVALYNSNGTVAAKYEYDAYGKLLSVTTSAGIAITGETSIANLNPLRYRGYVYDNETGFYYLQSRYYDPTTCRFVNADGYVSTIEELLGNNMFNYCCGNPILQIDPFGTWAVTIFPVGGSASFVLGVSYNFGIAFDDKGNFDVIVNYANSLHDSNTSYHGLIGVGGTFSVQYYNVDDISGVYGYSDSMGGTGGPFWFVGHDITLSYPVNDVSEIIGFQTVGGIGLSPIPFEVHAVSSKTESAKDFFSDILPNLSKTNSAIVSKPRSAASYRHILTVMERKLGGIV